MTIRPRPGPRRRARSSCSTRSRARSPIDCTFGAGGHARLVAERLGPDRHADRHRPRPARPRSASPSSPPSVPCGTRFIRASFADGAAPSCATRACAPTSSTSTSACPRCRSTRASAASPTPTTRRWTCAWTPTQELDAARRSSTSGTSAGWPRVLRDYGEERYARQIARAIVRARASARRSRRRTSSSTSITARSRRRRASPAAIRPSASFQAIRIAVNDELGQLDAALPAGLGAAARGRPVCRDLLPLAGRPPREALPRRPRAGLHLPARPAGLRLRSRAGGRAAHAPRRRADARRDRRQPASRVRAPARRPQAQGGGRQ